MYMLVACGLCYFGHKQVFPLDFMAEPAEITLFYICEVCMDNQQLYEQLANWELVPKPDGFNCPKCKNPLKLCTTDENIKNWTWYCGRKIQKPKQKAEICQCSIKIFKNTFFGNTHLSIRQILGFVNLWVDSVKLVVIMKQCAIGSWETSVNWASFCREVVLDAYIDADEKLGGAGMEVEIDESKFGKRKYHRGKHVEGKWVFGMYERGSGRVVMKIVEKRDRNTLVPLIKEWIEEGTTILSDCWKSYATLDEEGYQHLTVNHSITFKDKLTGAHTNSIEGCWSHAKASMMMRGFKGGHLAGNLARFMFQKRCRDLNIDKTREFFRLAGSLYKANGEPIPADEIDEDEIENDPEQEFS